MTGRERASAPTDDERRSPSRTDGGAADAGETASREETQVPRDPDWATPTAADRRALAAAVPSFAGDRLAIPGLVVAAAGLVLGGPAGIVAAGVATALWAIAAPVYAATAVALLAAAVGSGGPAAVLVAAGIVGLLLPSLARFSEPSTPLSAATVAGALAGGVVAAGLWRDAPAAAAAGLVLVVGGVAYACHRYSLVRISYRDSP